MVSMLCSTVLGIGRVGCAYVLGQMCAALGARADRQASWVYVGGAGAWHALGVEVGRWQASAYPHLRRPPGARPLLLPPLLRPQHQSRAKCDWINNMGPVSHSAPPHTRMCYLLPKQNNGATSLSLHGVVQPELACSQDCEHTEYSCQHVHPDAPAMQMVYAHACCSSSNSKGSLCNCAGNRFLRPLLQPAHIASAVKAPARKGAACATWC
jgi:hypothetical protein